MLHHFAPAEQYEVDSKVAMMLYIEQDRQMCLYTSIVRMDYVFWHAHFAVWMGSKREYMKLTFLKYLKSSASFIFSNVHSPEIPLFLLLLSPPNTNIIPLVVKKSFPSFWGNLPYNLKSHFFLATHDKHVTLCGQKSVAGKLSLFSNCDAHLVLSILCKWLSNWTRMVTHDHEVG